MASFTDEDIVVRCLDGFETGLNVFVNPVAAGESLPLENRWIFAHFLILSSLSSSDMECEGPHFGISNCLIPPSRPFELFPSLAAIASSSSVIASSMAPSKHLDNDRKNAEDADCSENVELGLWMTWLSSLLLLEAFDEDLLKNCKRGELRGDRVFFVGLLDMMKKKGSCCSIALA